MPSQESSPLLGPADDRPSSATSHESTPLLLQDNTQTERVRSSSLRSYQPKSPRFQWPTIIAITFLASVVLFIMAVAFVAPTIVEEYAKQSMVIEPTNLSIHSFTSNGVRARIQADFCLDASRVENQAVRTIGRAGTWLARQVGSKDSVVKVYLPEYGNMLLGNAMVPPIVVSIRNGDKTHVDFISDLIAGDEEGIKRLANDWLEGKLGQLRIQGKADVDLVSGIFPLGTQSISHSLVFEGHDLPSIPQYNITHLDFHEVDLPSGRQGMGADVSLSIINDFPVEVTIPPLGFDILVPNCQDTEPYISLADAITESVSIEPNSDVEVDVGGVVQTLPKPLISVCPGTTSSPLDSLLGNYMQGNDTTIFVRGSANPTAGTPKWMSNIISSITVPLPFPGHEFGNIVKNFSLTDVNFELPNPWADPKSPDSKPQISGFIKVTAALPKEINFGLNVTRVRASADVYYKGKNFGVLDLKKWQKATSQRSDSEDGSSAVIKIESRIKNAPLNVTDQDVFSSLVQAMLFGSEDVILKIEALVDVEIVTVLGPIIVKNVPGEGEVPVAALAKGGLSTLSPKVYDLQILDTGKTSITLQARVNFTNPTKYTAQIPYANVHILNNNSVIAQATVKDVKVTGGNNTNVLVNVIWDPFTLGGKKSQVIGRNLLSQYVSGWNTTLTIKTHKGTIPTQPALGEALSVFGIEFPTPRLSSPHYSDGDDNEGNEEPHFIKDATFHLFSSTATFTLLSPLQRSSIYIDHINATAFYNRTEAIGKIIYDLPFKVPPGSSQTPRLPVDWSLDSVGYDRVRQALGGDLKLDATATVGIRLGQWTEEVWFVGGGIGAKVRF